MPHIWVKMGSQRPQPMDGGKASGLKTSTLFFNNIFFRLPHNGAISKEVEGSLPTGCDIWLPRVPPRHSPAPPEENSICDPTQGI